jgi:group I intron endonuclease
MENSNFIYGLIDPITNQLRYVGKSINPKNRLRKHISERNLHDSYKDRWVRKLYNLDLRPELIIIDVINNETDDWRFWEVFYISYFKSIGCNLTNGTLGGDQPPSTKGRKQSLETRTKMSKSKSGKPPAWWVPGTIRSEEHKQNLSKSCKGRVSPNKGKKYSEEHKAKLVKASTVNKPVLQLDLDGNLIKEWPSKNLAQKTLKIRHIYECCNNLKNFKTAGGYRWVYKN